MNSDANNRLTIGNTLYTTGTARVTDVEDGLVFRLVITQKQHGPVG
jgi:hypothetical protein